MCLTIPGKILTILEEENLGLRRGTVAFGNIRREVCLDYTPEAVVGDYILVHVGFAVTVLDPDDARRTFAELPAFAQRTAATSVSTPVDGEIQSAKASRI